MVVERVEDAVDRGPRQAEMVDEFADARPVVAFLEKGEHIHHPVDDRDAMPRDGLGRHLILPRTTPD